MQHFSLKHILISLIASTFALNAAKADLSTGYGKDQCKWYYYDYGEKDQFGYRKIACIDYNGDFYHLYNYDLSSAYGSKSAGSSGKVGYTTNEGGALVTIKANQDWSILTKYFCSTRRFDRGLNSSSCTSEITKSI